VQFSFIAKWSKSISIALTQIQDGYQMFHIDMALVSHLEQIMTPPTIARQAKPTFLFMCKDGPDAPRLRSAHLAGHLNHVETHWTSYVTAGPLKAPGSSAIHGSCLIVIADNVDAAWALMKGDPYFTSGLFDSVEVHDMTMSIGLYPGGKIWESAEAIAHRANGG
jgi:uncharacterized protein